MDTKKQAKFNEMTKRQKFSKGGMIRHIGGRKYFDNGGLTAAPTALTGPNGGGTNQNATNPNTGIMGTIGGALGLNNNFQATSADIQKGTNAAQLNQAYTDTQNALTNQTAQAQTLAPQTGTAVSNQNALAAQELAMTQGGGPNPAQAQLNQNTATNVANTTAAMAGQRGAAGNVGMLTRQAGQQGAATQQQAVGQAATMEANQQIAAQDRLANLSNAQISQAGQANTNLSSAQQNEQNILQGANTSANNAAVGMQSNINNVNSQTSAANQNMASNIMGGILSGGGATGAISSMFAGGGKVKAPHIKLAEMNAHSMKHYDEGGDVESAPETPPAPETPNEGTFTPDAVNSSAPNIPATASLPADQTDLSKAMSSSGGGGGGGKGIGGLAALMADGGNVPNLGTGTYSPVASSSGPNIGSTAALPTNTMDFSKAVSKKKQPPQDPNALKGGNSQTQEQANRGYADADAILGNSPMNVLPADNTNDTMSGGDMQGAARGGRIYPGPHKSHVANFMFAHGGESKMVPAMVSPGEIYLNPSEVKHVVETGANPLKMGKKFLGKPKVKGDSTKNDTIPADLEEGGVVIPRHIMNKPNADKAELFVRRAVHMTKPKGK